MNVDLAINQANDLYANLLFVAITAAVVAVLLVFWIWKTSKNTEKTVQLLVEENRKLDIIIQTLINKQQSYYGLYQSRFGLQ